MFFAFVSGEKKQKDIKVLIRFGNGNVNGNWSLLMNLVGEARKNLALLEFWLWAEENERKAAVTHLHFFARYVNEYLSIHLNMSRSFSEMESEDVAEIFVLFTRATGTSLNPNFLFKAFSIRPLLSVNDNQANRFIISMSTRTG